METIKQLGPELGIAATCMAFGVARATFYRGQQPKPAAPVLRRPPARKLSSAERKAVLDTLHEHKEIAP